MAVDVWMPVVSRLGILYFVQMAPDIATALYYTGIDPFTKKPVHVAKNMRDRKMQPALMQFFKPENWFAARGGKCCHRERLGDRPVYEVDRGVQEVAGEVPQSQGGQPHRFWQVKTEVVTCMWSRNRGPPHRIAKSCARRSATPW